MQRLLGLPFTQYYRHFGWRRALRAAAPVLAVCVLAQSAEAKAPGKTYCFHGVCHRVLTLAETQAAIGRTETLLASLYDHPRHDPGNPNAMTSSGEMFSSGNDRSVASPIYPDGTRLLIWHERTRAAAEVRVNNAGPYHGARKIDVSKRLAERLGFHGVGVTWLKVQVLAVPTAREAAYMRGRVYAPVRGFLGTFASLDGARAAFGAAPNSIEPNPILTGALGWTTTVVPVRPPLQRGAARPEVR